MARALVTLGERDGADGRAWHLPAAEPLTGRQFLRIAYAAAGHTPRIGRLPKLAVRAAGLFVPTIREVLETSYQFEQPLVSDAARFQEAFGPFDSTPHAEPARRARTPTPHADPARRGRRRDRRVVPRAPGGDPMSTRRKIGLFVAAVAVAGVTDIRVVDTAFAPPVVQVEAGSELTWIFAGEQEHNLVGAGFSSAARSTGTFSHTFDQPGSYPYRCTLHIGMEGRVEVVARS